MSTIIVDTNVILDILTDDEDWYGWSANSISALEHINKLIINPIIYSELSVGFNSKNELDMAISDFAFGYEEIDRFALYKAAKAFMRYKRDGGKKRSPLPDFYIGAQADVKEYVILTRDRNRYSKYFPGVELMAP